MVISRDGLLRSRYPKVQQYEPTFRQFVAVPTDLSLSPSTAANLTNQQPDQPQHHSKFPGASSNLTNRIEKHALNPRIKLLLLLLLRRRVPEMSMVTTGQLWWNTARIGADQPKSSARESVGREIAMTLPRAQAQGPNMPRHLNSTRVSMVPHLISS